MDFGPVLALLMLAPWPEGLPPLRDLERFPPEKPAGQRYVLANEHVAWVRGEWYKTFPYSDNPDQVSLGQFLYKWKLDAEWRERCWLYLYLAASCEYSDKRRRENLKYLHDSLGDADYFAGRMPCPVPLERLQRIHEP